MGRRVVLTVKRWQCLSKYSIVDTISAFTLFLTLYLDRITKSAVIYDPLPRVLSVQMLRASRIDISSLGFFFVFFIKEKEDGHFQC